VTVPRAPHHSGVFTIARSIFHHPLFEGDPYSRRDAWEWLISEAAWKPRRRSIDGRMVPLGRGQLVASVRHMARIWGWDKARVERFLGRLKTEAMIKTSTDTGITVITICNYEEYQFSPGASETPTETTARQQRDNTEEVNKEIEKSEDTAGAVSSPTYAFESGVIRLNAKDLARWKAAFPNLNVEGELIGLTEWANQQGPQRWFHAVAGALAKRSREARATVEKQAARPYRWNGIEGVI
jgi:DNA-binding transcriptional MocR family regulator